MKQILNLYRSKYPFESFYEQASVKIMKNKRLLGDNYPYLVDNSTIIDIDFKANPGDIRVDLPIWFGDPSKVKLKVIHPNARQNKKTGMNAWETAEIEIAEIIKSLK